MLSDKLFKGLQNVDPIEIRTEVFVKEEGFVDEFDEYDQESWHIVIYEDDKPIATGRAYQEGSSWHIGRIAIRKEHRGKGIGTLVMKKLEEKIKEEGGRRAILFSQYDKTAFYEKCGYRKENGDIVLDQGYPHIKMFKIL